MRPMVIRGATAHVSPKSLQANKIEQIGHALVVSGLVCLEQQANALGIARSTAWTIVNGKHKASGLSAVVINQMLMSPKLPALVRAKLFEYIEEKLAGAYGHSRQQLHRFATRLMTGGLAVHQQVLNGHSAANNG
jgi:hypothetical protein